MSAFAFERKVFQIFDCALDRKGEGGREKGKDCGEVERSKVRGDPSSLLLTPHPPDHEDTVELMSGAI